PTGGRRCLRLPGARRLAVQVAVDRQPDGARRAVSSESRTAIRDPANRSQPQLRERLGEPGPFPSDLGTWRNRKPMRLRRRDRGAMLADAVAETRLPLQVNLLALAVAAKPILVALVLRRAMKDVEAGGVAIDRRRPIAAVVAE